MRMMVNALRRGVAVLAVGWLAGCAASEPAPQDQYYRVDPGVPTQQISAPALNGVVLVDRFAVEGLTSGRAINFVDADAPNRLQQYFYHHWSEPPNVMLRDSLVRYVRASGVGGTIITPVVRTDADVTVSGAIHKFERRMDDVPTAVIELEIAVTDFDTGRLIHVATYAVETPASGASLDSTVDAFNTGLATVFSRFLADISRL